MHPTQIPRPIHHAGWVYEEKVDGWRMVARKDGTAVKLVSRQGVDHTRRFHREGIGGAPFSAPVRVRGKPYGEGAVLFPFHGCEALLFPGAMRGMDARFTGVSAVSASQLERAAVQATGIVRLSSLKHLLDLGPTCPFSRDPMSRD
jgi:hypothetical protein